LIGDGPCGLSLVSKVFKFKANTMIRQELVSNARSNQVNYVPNRGINDLP